MAIDDPKKYMPKAKPIEDEDDGDDLKAQVLALQEQVQALVKMQTSSGGLSEDKLEAIMLRVAQASADAAERAANPSNKTHPGISVYSYPEGDRARPRALKCPMTWAGYDLGIDTTTAEEIELLNVAVPGVYTFQRTDKSFETLTVTGTTDAGGTITKLSFSFLVKDNRETLPDNATMLRQAFGVKTAEQIELEKLRAELAAMRTQAVVAQ